MVLAWAGNYLFVRVGEGYTSPIWLAALRASVGALGVGVYLLVRTPAARLPRADARDALLLGLPNTALFLGLWFVAAPAVPPGQAAVLVYTFPLWVALFSSPLLGTTIGRRQWVAVTIGFLGIVLTAQPWASGTTRTPVVPLLELLGAAVSWAFATVLFQRRFSPSTLGRANGYQLLGGAAALGVVALVVGGPPPWSLSPGLWVAILWLGLFGTAFAYGVWFFLLRTVHASSLSAYAFLVPLAALALSAWFDAERLTLVQVGGVALVLAGLYLVSQGALPTPYGRPAAGNSAE